MTVTLDLTPENEAAFKAQAQARGISLEEWILEVAHEQVQPISVAHLQTTNPQERAKYFDAWVDRARQVVCVNGLGFFLAPQAIGRWESGNPGFGFPLFHRPTKKFLVWVFGFQI